MTTTETPIDWDRLTDAAHDARRRAYAPHSGYRVGAALLTAGGRIHTGANVENGLLGLSICAERVAVAVAVNAGDREFQALAVATASEPPAAPCGLCRQTLVEFTRDLPVVCVNEAGGRHHTSLSELFPQAFRLEEALPEGGGAA